MRHLLLLAEFARTPWAMLPQTLDVATAIVLRWADGVKLSAEDLTATVGDAPAGMQARAEAESRAGGDLVAVVPVFGIIGHRIHQVESLSSGMNTSTERLQRVIRTLAADESVGGIVLDIDSPGGSAFGLEELCETIHEARERKPVLAVANACAASAAYWIGSCASEFCVSPGGMAGSIGVFTRHEDVSKFLEMKGIKSTLIAAGKFKTEGNPYEPLGAEALESIQGSVDKYYGVFTKTVARNRGVTPKEVREGFGEGRMLLAGDAVKEKMVDRIATLDQVILGLQKQLAKPKRSAATRERALKLATS